jgi:hypothetical protein
LHMSARAGSFVDQISHSTKVFELPWHPLHDEVARVANDYLVWRWWFFLFFFLSFCVYPFKISKESFNLLFLRILSLFFLLMFVLFRIIYRIEIIFNIISLQYFLLFKFGSHSFYCYFFYLRYFLIDFFLQFHPP